MADQFKDRVVIVTGGSRGLGRAMSTGFAAEGAKVVVASRKLDSCREVVGEIESAGGEALALFCTSFDEGSKQMRHKGTSESSVAGANTCSQAWGTM